LEFKILVLNQAAGKAIPFNYFIEEHKQEQGSGID
jgi:hypothetical protein